MIVHLKSFAATMKQHPEIRLGCVVDTNILFGAAYPSDRLNTWAERFFDLCRREKVPVYTNINIRTEFLDLFRRVLIVESLILLRSNYRSDLSEALEKRIKALDQMVQDNIKKNRSTQISERDIKEYRSALLAIFPKRSTDGLNLWQILCRDFLEPQLKPIWTETTEALGINFAGSRAVDSKELFASTPNWDGAIGVMGRSGLGSADAMIVNFFVCSKFQLLVTADNQVAEYAETCMIPPRITLVPTDDELE